MTGLLHWCAMNGYAMYVWPAYGLVAFLLTMNLFLIKKQSRLTHTLLRQWFKA